MSEESTLEERLISEDERLSKLASDEYWTQLINRFEK